MAMERSRYMDPILSLFNMFHLMPIGDKIFCNE